MDVIMFPRLSCPSYVLHDTLTGVWKHGRLLKHKARALQTNKFLFF